MNSYYMSTRICYEKVRRRWELVTVEDYRDEVLLDKEAAVHVFYKYITLLSPCSACL